MVEVVKPKYFIDFECIGSQCEDNCCKTNYQLNIDKKFYKHMLYKSKIKIDGDQVFERLKTTPHLQASLRNYASMKKDENGHCFFVSKEGLCQVYQKDGVEKMPDMCKEYPRITLQRGSRLIEKHLTLGCPEAVRRLLFYADALDPIIEHQPSNHKLNKIPYQRPLWFAELRLLLRDILLIEDASFEENLYTVGFVLSDLQALQNQPPAEMFQRIEYFREVIATGSVRHLYHSLPCFPGATALIFTEILASLKEFLAIDRKTAGRFFELSTLLEKNIIAFSQTQGHASLERFAVIEKILQHPLAVKRYQDYIATQPFAWINYFLNGMLTYDFPKEGWQEFWFTQAHFFIYARSALTVIALERELNNHDLVWVIQSLYTLLHSAYTKKNLDSISLEVDRRLEGTISKSLDFQGCPDWSIGVMFALIMPKI